MRVLGLYIENRCCQVLPYKVRTHLVRHKTTGSWQSLRELVIFLRIFVFVLLVLHWNGEMCFQPTTGYILKILDNRTPLPPTSHRDLRDISALARGGVPALLRFNTLRSTCFAHIVFAAAQCGVSSDPEEHGKRERTIRSVLFVTFPKRH